MLYKIGIIKKRGKNKTRNKWESRKCLYCKILTNIDSTVKQKILKSHTIRQCQCKLLIMCSYELGRIRSSIHNTWLQKFISSTVRNLVFIRRRTFQSLYTKQDDK